MEDAHEYGPPLVAPHSNHTWPKFEIISSDVVTFVDELRCFHDEFSDCFHRSETRDNVFRYMVGQFSKLERKSIEPIALAVEDGQVRAIQRAISDTNWDEEKILVKYRSMVNDDMGDTDGVLLFDESGFVKKGKDSAGVQRQKNTRTKTRHTQKLFSGYHEKTNCCPEARLRFK